MIPVEIKNLKKMYGKSLGVSDVTFNVKEGEIFGFIGPNGAGKSTTIRAMLGLIRPTDGYTAIFGEDGYKHGVEARENVGYLPGEVFMHPDMKVRDLLEFSANLRGGRGLERIDELSSKFEINLNKRFRELSLGNKKKVGIVNAIMSSPKLIILDEPTTGLDPIMQQTFFEVLREENKKGSTILLSSHNLNEVQRLCDRVAIIKAGKIIAVEEMQNLKNKFLKEVMFETKQSELMEINLSGVSNLKIEGRRYEFQYNGEVRTLVDYLSKFDVINVNIADADLEKIFLHFYE
ncbi:MAG: ABC transporter ATP-binding protein [Spirochaetales bacterium]